ncbi:hypothetical protein NDU88_004360 [Pleurodeles waltl]|uniref:Uncharacterized protein n=1 Tax=Pleurodeles waltl TaxID=8319 RepID=A0AAV7PET9_PLEWA|nr:hypothetical protein NDU88_004360 [Pleurodeles waltl]
MEEALLAFPATHMAMILAAIRATKVTLEAQFTSVVNEPTTTYALRTPGAKNLPATYARRHQQNGDDPTKWQV